MAEDRILLTVSETAGVLRISRNLAYELVTRGEIPAIRLGRVIRVPRAALDRWLEVESSGASAGSRRTRATRPVGGPAGGTRGDDRVHREAR